MNKTLSERFGIFLLLNWQKTADEVNNTGRGYATVDSWVMTYTGIAIGTYFIGVQRAQYIG